MSEDPKLPDDILVLLVILCGWLAIAGAYAAYRLILIALGRSAD